MLRRTSLCVAGAISLIASAHAADLYGLAGGYKDAPDVPVTTWTGFYVGMNGGYGWSDSNSSLYAEALSDSGFRYGPDVATSPTVHFDKAGGFVGGQAGYNLQWNQFVLGVETDFQGAGIDGSASASTSVTPALPPSFRGGLSDTVSASAFRESTLDYFGTVRGRLGYTFGPALIYATGGFAYGGFTGNALATLGIDSRGGTTTYNYAVTGSTTRTGYVLGGGLEYALSPQWSLKGEYQYIDLGGNNGYVGYHLDNSQGVVVDRARGYYTIEQNFNTVRVGLNYKLQALVAPLK